MTTPEFSPDCPYCRQNQEPFCLFAQFAQYFAQNPDMSPEEKQVAIAQARLNARNRICPHLNNINPGYEGINNL
jgi:hypothetical protein